ncbi:MAG: PspC domain-containing protein [Pseudomonadales bacterium]
MSDRKGSNRNSQTELERAARALEDAVQDMVRGARDDLSGRAADLLEETTRRLRGEDRPGAARGERFEEELRPKSRKLFRDPYNRRIAGVCAGFARYFGIEVWVARLLAFTGFLFLPSLVLPAYFIACLVLNKPGRDMADRVDSLRNDHRSPAPEFGPRHAPRRSLRQVHADLTDAELKLRRMETHVTSNQYALRRELDALDGSH